DFSLIRWLVYCHLSSGELWGPAAKEKGDGKDTRIITTKDRHSLENIFISLLLFERLRGAACSFVNDGKERVFCQISDYKIGGVSGGPRGNTPAFASSEFNPFAGRIVKSAQGDHRRTTDVTGKLLS